jgi:hypothetical protein
LVVTYRVINFIYIHHAGIRRYSIAEYYVNIRDTNY